MNITETTFNQIFYIIVPLLLLIGIKMNEKILIFIFLLILLYHIYSNHKYSTWPFNSVDNIDSICDTKVNPYWSEFVCVIGAIILIYIGIKNLKEFMLYSIIIIIVGIIFGMSHVRQIFVCDNIYYKWMYSSL